MNTLNRALDRAEDEMFAAWRSAALDKMPYLAPLLFSVSPVSSTWVDTAAVDDGLRLYLNFEKISGLGPTFASEVLLHECSHVMAHHSEIARQIGVTREHHDLWNAAADLAINDDLVACGCSTLAEHGLVPSKVRLNGVVLQDNLTPNEYFGALLRAVESQKNSQTPSQQGQGQGSPHQGQGQQNQETEQQGQGQQNQETEQQGQGQGSAGDQPKFTGCGSGSGGQTGPGELAPTDDLSGKAPALDGDEIESVLRETAERMEEHAKNRGTLPAGMMDLIEKINQKDEIRWEKVLSAMFRRGCQRVKGNSISTYKRINRRRATQRLRNDKGEIVGRILYPGTEKYVPKVRVYVDSSGSMSVPELEKALAIVMNLSKRMKIKGENLTVTYVDAAVHGTSKFNGLRSINTVQGRGGTDMRVCFEDASSQKKNPDLIVIITDGYTPWPEKKPAYGTIVCSTTKNMDGPSWAKNVYVKVA